MLTKGKLLAVASAFLFGLLVPVLLSIISMTISFRYGVIASTFLVPLSSISDLGEEAVMIGNGFIYGGIALLVVSLGKAASPSR